MSLKVGIVGAAGYAGAELIRLVLGHPEFELAAITSNADAGQQPKTASVIGTNAAQIGLALNKRAGVLVATGAIDNLCKGAAGQAVQCANIVFGFDERRGLPTVACPV